MSSRKLSNDHSVSQPPVKKAAFSNSNRRQHRRGSSSNKGSGNGSASGGSGGGGKKEKTFQSQTSCPEKDQLVYPEREELEVSSVLKIYAARPQVKPDFNRTLVASLRLISICISKRTPDIHHVSYVQNFPGCCFHENVDEEDTDFGNKFQTVQAVGLGIKLKELLS